MKIVNFENYGNYSSENYGVNSLMFRDVEGNEFYFSYQTLVAFTFNGNKYVHVNDWKTTTGKHLNWIDGGGIAKKNRLTAEEFELKYNECFMMEAEVE